MDYREDINTACHVMEGGGIILYPTDTIWGIGCDATNPEAVDKVYKLKRRADSKAMIVLVDSAAKIDFYVDTPSGLAWDLMEAATRPLTIIYDRARNLAPNLLAEDGSVGIRVTQERFSRDLCRRFRKAVVSTSANFSGCPSPRAFAEIDPELLAAVDYVVQYGQDAAGAAGRPSSVVKLFHDGQVEIIRE